jgi:iron complex transport system substrate-binding protein
MTRRATGAVFISVLLLVPCLAAGVEAAHRIVSLSPHLTELVFDAGAGDRLAGAVEYSDYPPEARDIPRVGDAFRIDREMLARVGPDLILAWKGGTPPATVEQLREDGYRVVVIETRNPEQVAAALETIAELAGTQDAAAPRVRAFRKELSELRRRFGDRPAIRVFVQISPRPLYTVGEGQLTDSLLEVCGGRNVFGDINQLAPVVTEEAVIAADPQVIIAPRLEGEDVLEHWKRYPSIDAVGDKRLHVIDGDLISRQSLRLLDGAREICNLLEAARSGG